jgi:murein DD-endopeptidase MepM/ murein hydrolase activator NlpD
MQQMKRRFLKRLHKIFVSDFTLMLVPNSCNKKIRSCRVPFISSLIILSLITFNIYIFLTYSTQVWQISHFQQKIMKQNKLITKLNTEKSHVEPVLAKSLNLEAEFNSYRQESQEMFAIWQRLHQKGNFRFALASRGVFRSSNKTGSYVLTSISQTNHTTTSLDQLDHNLGQLKNILQKETQEQSQLYGDLKAYERHIDHTPSIWPVYARIGSPFGVRFHPILKKYIGHEGVDLEAEYGTKVRATADGVVIFSGWEDGYGNMVKIQHDYGCETYYGHNSRLLVYQGESVKKGQIISISGNTGESTGPHLHYEVRINGKPVNPVPFLNN